MSVLIIVEHDEKNIKPATLHTITAAQEIAKETGKAEVDLCILGHNCQSVVEEAQRIEGVRAIKCFMGEAFKNHLAEPMAQGVLSIAKEYTHILAPASTFGKNLMPRVAAQLDVMQLSDIIKVHPGSKGNAFDRPIYAGNAIATVESLDPIKVITVRPTAFGLAKLVEMNSKTSAGVDKVDFQPSKSRTTFVSLEESKSERPELTSAKIVVSGGRALSSKENFSIIEKLADCLNAAVGASRAAVDAGYVPNDYQVGQTGKVVAPELYIAIGISGAIQHLAGMKDSKIIIAINKDPDAPIFQIADYGYVGDLFEVVPQITQQICGK